MAALTSSSSALRPRTNPAAQLAVVLGAAAVLVIPAAIAASWYVPRLALIDAVYGSVSAAVVLGLLAVGAARRARRRLALSLGRAGGEGAARAGRTLALVGLYLGATGIVAIAFFAVLRFYS